MSVLMLILSACLGAAIGAGLALWYRRLHESADLAALRAELDIERRRRMRAEHRLSVWIGLSTIHTIITVDWRRPT